MLGLELPVVTTLASWGDDRCSDKHRSNEISGWIALRLQRSVGGRVKCPRLGNQDSTCVGCVAAQKRSFLGASFRGPRARVIGEGSFLRRRLEVQRAPYPVHAIMKKLAIRERFLGLLLAAAFVSQHCGLLAEIWIVVGVRSSVAPEVQLVVSHHKDSQCTAVMHRSGAECARDREKRESARLCFLLHLDGAGSASDWRTTSRGAQRYARMP